MPEFDKVAEAHIFEQYRRAAALQPPTLPIPLATPLAINLALSGIGPNGRESVDKVLANPAPNAPRLKSANELDAELLSIQTDLSNTYMDIPVSIFAHNGNHFTNQQNQRALRATRIAGRLSGFDLWGGTIGIAPVVLSPRAVAPGCGSYAIRVLSDANQPAIEISGRRTGRIERCLEYVGPIFKILTQK